MGTFMDASTHECTAQHCVTCCPEAKAYGKGYEDAKSLYASMNTLSARKVVSDVFYGIMPILVIVMLCLVIDAYRRQVRRDRLGRIAS